MKVFLVNYIPNVYRCHLTEFHGLYKTERKALNELKRKGVDITEYYETEDRYKEFNGPMGGDSFEIKCVRVK